MAFIEQNTWYRMIWDGWKQIRWSSGGRSWSEIGGKGIRWCIVIKAWWKTNQVIGGKRILRWEVWSSGGTSGVDPYGYQISSTRAIPGPMIVGQDDSYKRTPLTLTSFVMPSQDPETVKQYKHEWYVKNREAILKRKQQHPAAKKKQQQPWPKLPPSPKLTVRRKELNRQACNRYRDSHREKVRAINRTYYHSNRERIVWQQRESGANAKNPFGKLPALAQVCTEQLRSLYHVPTSQKIGTTPTIQGEEENSCGRDGGHEGHQQTVISGKDSPTPDGGRIRNIQETQSDRGRATLSKYVRRPTGRSVPEKSSVSKSLKRKNGARGDVWRVPEMAESATLRKNHWEKTSHGSGGVQRLSVDAMRSCEGGQTEPLELVRRPSGTSLSLTMATSWVDGTRKWGGGGHCAGDLHELFGSDGPLLVTKPNKMNGVYIITSLLLLV